MDKSESNEDGAASERERQLAALVRHLMQSAENEKAVLARELHGELGAFLTVASLDVSVVVHKLKQGEPELAARLQRVLDKAKDAAAFKRQVVERLRPSMLDGLGLAACLNQHALDFGKRTGLQVTTDIHSDADVVEPDAAIAMFRIMQDALADIEHLAQAGAVQVALREHDGGTMLSIADDGAGTVCNANALTLIGMRERAAMFGGRLTVGRREQGGTTVEAWFPLPN